MIASSIHGNLGASACSLISAPDGVSASGEAIVNSSEACTAADARIASQRTSDDATLALGACEGEAIVKLGSSEGRAGACGIPCALADDTALLRASNFNIDVPLATERSAWCTRARRGRPANRSARRSWLAARLGEVLDARLWARRLGAVRVRRHKLARLQRPAHIVVVPDLVQLARLAAQGDLDTWALRCQGVLDGLECVCCGAARRDARCSEPLVGRQGLVQRDGAVEVVDYFLGGLVLGVAFGLERGNAGAVFGPLVVPEGLVVALVVLPVGLHEGEGVVCAEGLQDRGDIGVGAGRVAVGVVGAVAAVWPVDRHG